MAASQESLLPGAYNLSSYFHGMRALQGGAQSKHLGTEWPYSLYRFAGSSLRKLLSYDNIPPLSLLCSFHTTQTYETAKIRDFCGGPTVEQV
jgi:hypothetical protein